MNMNQEITMKNNKVMTNIELDDIQKAHLELFGDSIEKAVYADTAQNRKLGRVGQEYHRGKGGNKEDTDIKAHIKALRKEIRELSKTSKEYGAMSRDHKNFKRLVELEAQLDEALKTKKSGKSSSAKSVDNSSKTKTNKNVDIWTNDKKISHVKSLMKKLSAEDRKTLSPFVKKASAGQLSADDLYRHYMKVKYKGVRSRASAQRPIWDSRNSHDLRHSD